MSDLGFDDGATMYELHDGRGGHVEKHLVCPWFENVQTVVWCQLVRTCRDWCLEREVVSTFDLGEWVGVRMRVRDEGLLRERDEYFWDVNIYFGRSSG